MKKIVKLVKRSRLKNKTKSLFPVYDICVVRKATKKKLVFEKLGAISIMSCLINLNVFRLCFWLAKGAGLSGNTRGLLERINIITYY